MFKRNITGLFYPDDEKKVRKNPEDFNGEIKSSKRSQYFNTTHCAYEKDCKNRKSHLCVTCKRNHVILHDYFEQDDENIKKKLIKKVEDGE